MARSRHDDWLGHRKTKLVALRAGERVDRYIGRTSARLEGAGGRARIVDSTIPLRAKDEEGHLKPVDLALEDRGEFLAPENPLVDLKLPEELADGLALAGADVVVHPEVDETSAAAKPVEDTAFWTNIDTDTDFAAGPTPQGFETFWQLRSSASPESLRTDVDLPEGAKLRADPERPGAFEVVRDEKVIARVSPPLAKDADGEPVPAQQRQDGNALVVSVDHRDRDVAYPIAVDPEWWEDFDNYTNLTGWVWGTSNGSNFWSQATTGYQGFGLYNITDLNVTEWYWANDMAMWTFNPQGNAAIVEYDSYVRQDVHSNPSDTSWCMAQGTFNGSAWEGGGRERCGSFNYEGWVACPWDCVSAAGGNYAIFQLVQHAGGPKSPWVSNYQAYAIIYYTDESIPSPSSNGYTPPSNPAVDNWIDTQSSVNASATDPGLGIHALGVAYQATDGNWHLSTPSGGWVTQGCPGDRYGWCPNSWSSSVTYDTGLAKEGYTNFAVLASDPIANVGVSSSWQLKVDHSAPDVALSDALWSARIGGGGSGIVRDQVYKLGIDVTDGTSANPRSGVKSVEVLVDGVAQKSVATNCAGLTNCTAFSCTGQTENCKPAAFSWDFDASKYAEGQHTIRVLAKDRLNHATPSACTSPAPACSFTVTVRHHDTAEVGPGSIGLLDGVFSTAATDVSISGFGSSLEVSRTYNSKDPSTTANSILGPGWTPSIPVDGGASSFASVDEAPDGTALLTFSDGMQLAFLKNGTSYTPPASYQELVLTKPDGGTFKLTDGDGTETYFRVPAAQPNGSTRYSPVEVRLTGVSGATSIAYENVGGVTRPTKAIAPAPSGVSCSGSLVAGCRALQFTYATSTTATPGSPGDYIGRLKKVELTAYDPATSQMKTDTAAEYRYDQSGRLVEEWDPRVSPALKTTYDYDGNSRLIGLKPAGTPSANAWTIVYEALTSDPPGTGAGRLKLVTRSTPQGVATRRVIYKVPVSGAGAPHQMAAANVAAWSQSAAEAPATATAIFPPDYVPSSDPPASYARAETHYLDDKNREVNLALPGGRIATTEYDQYDNVIRSQTPTGRERAMAGLGGTSTLRTYSADGTEMTQQREPTHPTRLASGAVVDARKRTIITYDEGLGDLHLPTTIKVNAEYAGGPANADERVTKRTYDGTTRQQTSETKDYGGLNLTTKTFYNSDGLVTETRQPKDPNGTTAGTTKTTYYTASSTGDPACVNKPQWANLPCKTGPAAQPGTATPERPDIPTSTYTYNRLNQIATQTDGSGSTTRTTTNTYDSAGRVTSASVTGSGAGAGESLPTVQTTYEDTTGLPSTTSINDNGTTRTVARAYDAVGRPVSYADADANTSTTSYDLLGRPVTTNDGKGTQTRSYDSATGDLTQLVDAHLGTLTATYDADGQMLTQTLPSGLRQQYTYDATGTATRVKYDKTTNCSTNCTWYDDSVGESIHGQWLREDATDLQRDYIYDGAGRLTQAKTMNSAGCLFQDYWYDTNSNRTKYERRDPASGGACGPYVTYRQEHTYDSADRLTSSTGHAPSQTPYTYDAFGRTTRFPSHMYGVAESTAAYYVDDRNRSLTLGAATRSYALDPMRRERTESSVGGLFDGNVTTFHYGDDADTAVWVSESTDPTKWTRNIPGIDGNVIGIHDAQAGSRYTIANLHGDLIARGSSDPASTGLTNWASSDAFGARSPGVTRYQYLGTKLRANPYGMIPIRMGQRTYMPTLGRFLQTDPVAGGSANDYDYANADPVNSFDLTGQIPSGNPSEKAWCRNALHLHRCYRADRLGRTAESYAKRWFGKLEPRRRNGFRHCAWSGMMTVSFGWGGQSGAWGFLSHHEKGTPDPVDSQIDRHNNVTGKNVGEWWDARYLTTLAHGGVLADCRRRTENEWGIRLF